MKTWEIVHGDCRDVMDLIPGEEFDAIVTDPPYELGFMGKKWDSSGVAFNLETWRAAFRVIKPGGYLLAFGGSRTYHRIVCAIEDAGFEIRDQIMWLYGSGFPKSLDVSKAIDKMAGAEREQVAPKSVIAHQRNIGNRRPYMDDPSHTTDSDVPATAAAWQGWGTALKPAHEPIVVARKPLIGTVAENVLKHGTGALNIDGCRIEGVKGTPASPRRAAQGAAYGDLSKDPGTGSGWNANVGRWPANVIHDGSEKVLAAFPQAPGQIADASISSSRKTQNVYGAMRRGRGDEPSADSENKGAIGFKMRPGARRLDEGTAARFFYCAKASKKDRGEGNNHPTVKPTELMRYLCRLVTPPGGRLLDPFAGSGSTGRGAVLEGFRFTGIEKEAEYAEIARARIKAVT